ncbi:MAG: hypothetical protein V1850_06970 [Candidatus Bathyarchaeota archaeon]
MDGKERERKHRIEVQVCPRCLSSKVCRVSASSGDMTGALAILPPKYTCSECGWVGRIVIMRDVEIPEDDCKTDKGKET